MCTQLEFSSLKHVTMWWCRWRWEPDAIEPLLRFNINILYVYIYFQRSPSGSRMCVCVCARHFLCCLSIHTVRNSAIGNLLKYVPLGLFPSSTFLIACQTFSMCADFDFALFTLPTHSLLFKLNFCYFFFLSFMYDDVYITQLLQ